MYFELSFKLPFSPELVNRDKLHKAVWKEANKWGGTFAGDARQFLFGAHFTDNHVVVMARTQDKPTCPHTVNVPATTGEKYRFVITANPGRITARDEVVLGDWFNAQAASNGFEVNSLSVTSDAAAFVVKKNNPLFYINQATFTGELTVADEIAFNKSLITGIGRSKSYGFGLLIISTIQ